MVPQHRGRTLGEDMAKDNNNSIDTEVSCDINPDELVDLLQNVPSLD
jgi:hypothetical protein